MLRKIYLLVCLSLCSVSIVLTGCGPKGQANPSTPLEIQSLGAASSSILTASPYASIHIEIGYAPGMAPDANTVSYLVSFVSAHTYKSDGITVEEHQVSSQKNLPPLDGPALAALEGSIRNTRTQGNVLSVFILLTDGTSSADTQTQKEYGLAYNATSYAVFKQSILTFVDAQSTVRVEKTVLAHEFAHLMGLVNSVRNGVDLSSSKHCLNPTCLMYRDVYNGPSANQTPPALDSDCVNELKALGGK